MRDLSIIITARDEKWLHKTIEDILKYAEGNTEILVGLDGWVTDNYIYDHPKINWIVEKESIGQRAMQNRLAKMSEAKYIMKTDAHCSFSQGFDRKMMEAMDDKTIMAPVYLPLDAENWVPSANLPISWFGFDSNLITQIDKTRQTEKLIDESMCLHGSAWMITRENYWKWNVCDESLGSWGKQGTELGIKAYLNSGRCVVNKNCYYAHLERKKEDDFPYERDMVEIKRTRDEVDKRLKNKSIIGLIEKFNYPHDWTKELVDNLPNA